MKQIFFFIATFVFLTLTSFPQISYQGPAVGSVQSGVVLNTNNFPEAPIRIDPQTIIDRATESPFTEPFIIPISSSVTPSVYVEDPSVSNKGMNNIGSNTLLLKKFPGIPQTNSIPPDPTIAVGPNHVVACVNSRFSIWNKEGALLKSIDADQWCTPVLANPGAFDPQIIYDHFAGRWFMLWDNVNTTAQTAYFIIFISDDNDPLGTWYGYKLDARTNGNTVTNTWGDYPQIGFDDKAIYINSRQFYFTGGKLYDKIRILIKSELYAANGGPLTWKDLWGITIPGMSTFADVVHPSIQYGISNEHYFIWAARTGANFYGFYTLSNVLTNPTLSGRQIGTTFYGQTPNANQLGGSTLLIETNGSHVKTPPVLRNGFLYFTHSIRNTNFPNYSSIRYVKLNVNTNSIVENYELGADRIWYYYPTVAVDPEGNIAITASRSGLEEYIGSFYVTRKAIDPPGLSEGRLISSGLGNYVKDFGSGRNRWGDYLGIYSDPSDEYNTWLFPQHAAATNTWGTTVAMIRVRPFFGAHFSSDSTRRHFGNIEVGFSSDTLTQVIKNYGDTILTITNIPDSVSDFMRVSSHSFPINLNSFDSVVVKFVFRPKSAGVFNIQYTILNNSTNFTAFNFIGRGFTIQPANQNVLYSISGNANNGNFSQININTAAGTNIGISNFIDLQDIAIQPTTNLVYAIRSSALGTDLLRINAQGGDAYQFRRLPVPDLYSIAFDKNGVLYGIKRTGEIYRFELPSGDSIFVSKVNAALVTMKFNPANNQLWGTIRSLIGQRDWIIKINLQTGDTTRVGRTGFNVNTIGLAISSSGAIYGIKGALSDISDLFTIDTLTGVGTIVGPTGLNNLTGIDFSRNLISNNDHLDIPSNYSLSQNYPNPFNPSTRIEFSLPVRANIKLQIFNVIGELVYEFSNKELNAGKHSLVWNGLTTKGNLAGSGIYFYKLSAKGEDNSHFEQVRKMMLMK